MLNNKGGKGHKICTWLLAGVFCAGTLGFCAAPAYAATSYQSNWSVRDRYEREAEAQYEYKAARRVEQERRMRESTYDREEQERERHHRQHPKEEEHEAGNTHSQGEVNTAAIVGAIIGAILARAF